ncbi:NmrA family NAD(P)-binding protein [Chitinophaga pinensis]|uniref:NmrA family protein n=1 Tax=Chitinophaga pinensis (strain ATCC 43595 / DSM 2588 / LMG 13176 / NBRC 15968 / NCIMB 11800 / UQM 2034) TaxID=485918 RepID=A0A979G702_CHIPD|nr:NAD(P)H-binding protein [Chitinophaga pinensis]ACU61793.1 NmrA family protein [Chitinophaga pinensis DSM 2588]
MKIITTGSLGNVATPVVKQLIEAGHDVTVITSNPDKKSAIESLGAVAAVGSITDTSFLITTFKDADAVYAMMPPAMGATNMIENITRAGEAYAAAISNNSIQRVVFLSSVGADAAEGTGPVQGVHRAEQLLQQLSGVNVTVLRSGFFFVNFLRDIPLIKTRNIFGNNYDGDTKLALTHPVDLAAAIVRELQQDGNGFEVKYVVSDISTGNEVATLFGQAIGKPELSWTFIPDEQLQQGMAAAGLSTELAGLITELGQGVRAGIITKDFFDKGAIVTGSTKLQQFVEEFKARYQQA